MASAFHEAFRRHGFSKNWLRSAGIARTANKKDLLLRYYRGQTPPTLTCGTCNEFYPELALELDNLQVLCERCNLGKGAEQGGDWRGG